MAAQDEKLKPLYDQQSELRGQGMALDTQINQLKASMSAGIERLLIYGAKVLSNKF